jgi:queuine tRNA-ribosyltransferase
MSGKYFKTIFGDKVSLPIFFPDATRAVIRTLDSTDIERTKTPGILVNTYHLYQDLKREVLRSHNGIRGFMNYDGGVISDSGGFQVKLAKITDQGLVIRMEDGKKILFTPEDSISFQMDLCTDMVVVLDEFTPPSASRRYAKETVDRTVAWAKRSKVEFGKYNRRPYILGVVQGGEFPDLRKECIERLAEIGFDGYGYGGWPIREDKTFNYEVAEIMARYCPNDCFLYGLGVGSPEQVVALTKLGFTIFDCVLPTRDARHKRLYVYNAKSIEDINLDDPNFYSYYIPDKENYYNNTNPVSTACDCLLCKKYSRSYLRHLFKIGDISAMRLATIHNLRFYSLLMEKLRVKM